MALQKKKLSESTKWTIIATGSVDTNDKNSNTLPEKLEVDNIEIKKSSEPGKKDSTLNSASEKSHNSAYGVFQASFKSNQSKKSRCPSPLADTEPRKKLKAEEPSKYVEKPKDRTTDNKTSKRSSSRDKMQTSNSKGTYCTSFYNNSIK